MTKLVGLRIIWKETIKEKGTKSTVQCSRSCDNFHYINVTDPLIIQLIFICLSCPEKAHDAKEFTYESSKYCCKSGITTHSVKS